MQRSTWTKLALLLVVAGAFALAGCGGDDAYSISADDQARIDALMAELEEAEGDLEAANERAADAEAEIESLEARIGMMGDAPNMLEGASLYAELNAYKLLLEEAQDEVERQLGIVFGLQNDLDMAQANLAAANTEIGRLTGIIGMDPDDDDPNGSGLLGDLATANALLESTIAHAERLQGILGREPTEGDGGSGLRKELADAEAEVARLTMDNGTLDSDLMAAQAEVVRLTGEVDDLTGTLETAEMDRDRYKAQVGELEMQVGMMDDPTTDENEATGLLAALMEAQADRDMYKDMVGMMDDPETDENEATGLRAALMAAEMDRDMYMRMVGKPDDEASTADDATLYAKINAKDAEIARLTHELADANRRLAAIDTAIQKAVNIRAGEAVQDAIAANRVQMGTRDRLVDVDGDGTPDQVDIGGTPTDITTQRPFMANASTDEAMHDVSISGDVTVDDTGDSFRRIIDDIVAGRWTHSYLTRDNGGAKEDVTVSVSRGDDTVAPEDYVYFGWWLYSGADDDDNPIYMVEGFAGGNDPVPDVQASTDFLPITGTATYKGPASGMYVTRILSAGDLDDMEIGSFGAAATLTADFGAADAALASISGTVDDFRLSGDTNGSGWLVTLDEAEGFSTVTGSPNIVGGTTHVTFGGRRHGPVAGEWQGQFYDPDEVSGAPVAPGTIAGTFDAVTPNASLTGAFGAHVTDD